MKKILFNVSIILTALFFYSCEGDLDLTDPTRLDIDNFIIDAETAEQALFGVYADVQDRGYIGGEIQMMTGLYSDEFFLSGSFPHLNESLNNNIITNNFGNNLIFTRHYRVIVRANEVIAYTSLLDDIAIDPIIKENVIAEARALRALSYFRLVRLFGGLPLQLESIALIGPAAENVPRSSESEIINFVLSEIALAEGKIASNNPTTRITNIALQVLKADVNLWLGNYGVVESLLQPVIGQFSLTNTYAQLWNNDSNNEEIFRVDFSSTDSNALSSFFLLSGRREVAPTQALLNAFENGDSRLNQISNPNDPNSVFVRKYTNSAAKPYIYRYADVLLMYAEALARNNNPNAVDYLNMVRQRANLTDVALLNQSNVVDVISQERFVEFYAEGLRWSDVKRLGLSEQVINSKQGISYIERMLLWPIPQNEIDRNTNLTQADQNPGY